MAALQQAHQPLSSHLHELIVRQETLKTLHLLCKESFVNSSRCGSQPVIYLAPLNNSGHLRPNLLICLQLASQKVLNVADGLCSCMERMLADCVAIQPHQLPIINKVSEDLQSDQTI